MANNSFPWRWHIRTSAKEPRLNMVRASARGTWPRAALSRISAAFSAR